MGSDSPKLVQAEYRKETIALAYYVNNPFIGRLLLTCIIDVSELKRCEIIFL